MANLLHQAILIGAVVIELSTAALIVSPTGQPTSSPTSIPASKIDYNLIVAVVVITFFIILLMMCVLCCAIQKDKRHSCHSCAGKRKKLSHSTEHDPQNDCCMGDNCRQDCLESNRDAHTPVDIIEEDCCNLNCSGGYYYQPNQSTHSNQMNINQINVNQYSDSNQCCSDSISCATIPIQSEQFNSNSLPVRNNDNSAFQNNSDYQYNSHSDFYHDQIPQNTSEQQVEVEVECRECTC